MGIRTAYRRDEQINWIISYLKNNLTASSVDQAFHNDFFCLFGGKRKETLWGAQPVNRAMIKLRFLFDIGVLERNRIGLSGGAWAPGFPKWVYVYSLKKIGLK